MDIDELYENLQKFSKSKESTLLFQNNYWTFHIQLKKIKWEEKSTGFGIREYRCYSTIPIEQWDKLKHIEKYWKTLYQLPLQSKNTLLWLDMTTSNPGEICFLLPRNHKAWLQSSYLENENGEVLPYLHMDQLMKRVEKNGLILELEPIGFQVWKTFMEQKWMYFQWKFLKFILRSDN